MEETNNTIKKTEKTNPGGCWPGYLPNSINEDNLVIKKSDLENGGWRF